MTVTICATMIVDDDWWPYIDSIENELTVQLLINSKLVLTICTMVVQGLARRFESSCCEWANRPGDESARNRAETSTNRNWRGLEIGGKMHGRSEHGGH